MENNSLALIQQNGTDIDKDIVLLITNKIDVLHKTNKHIYLSNNHYYKKKTFHIRMRLVKEMALAVKANKI